MNQRSETQQKILDAAIKSFAAKGFHGTTTAEIAREAAVAEGTIFKYYKTKKLLLHGVLEFIVFELVPSVIMEPVEDVMKRCMVEDPKTVLKQTLLSKVEFLNQNISCIKIVINEMQYHEDIKENYLGKLVPSFLGKLEGALAIGMQKGIFRKLDPHTTVRSFMGMIAAMVLDKNVLNKELSISNELDTIFDIYLNGILAESK